MMKAIILSYLLKLGNLEGKSAHELSLRLGISGSAVSRVVSLGVKLGSIITKRSLREMGGISKLVYLTSQGKRDAENFEKLMTDCTMSATIPFLDRPLPDFIERVIPGSGPKDPSNSSTT